MKRNQIRIMTEIGMAVALSAILISSFVENAPGRVA